MVSLTELLHSARNAGLTWHRDHEQLQVRGPRSAGDIAKQLLARKAEVLATLATPSPSVTTEPQGEVTQNKVPAWLTEQLFARTISSDGSQQDWKLFPLFPKPTIVGNCDHCHESRWWRSIFGQHLICGVCHPPAFTHIIAEWLSSASSPLQARKW